MVQKIVSAENNYQALTEWFAENQIQTVLLVCDTSLPFLKIKDYFDTAEESTGVRIVKFDDFQPNPLYESVVKGVELFHKENCTGIVAVGGGSSMDVAKCIKLYSNMDPEINYLKQEIVPNDIPFLAVPTTAGTGSEATRYAVIYFEGEKQSVTSVSCIPGTVLMDHSALKTLPLYQKKSTMLDALMHAIESFWSVNSTEESKNYSREAIKEIMANCKGYLSNEDEANRRMLHAANTAGRAINITQTTAGHAMCYKLTSLFGIAHGHAAALCDRILLPYMIARTDKCIDPRGEEYLKSTLQEIAEAMGTKSPDAAGALLKKLVSDLELAIPEANEEQYGVLKKSVNPVRLKNHPIALDEETINELYHQILEK